MEKKRTKKSEVVETQPVEETKVENEVSEETTTDAATFLNDTIDDVKEAENKVEEDSKPQESDAIGHPVPTNVLNPNNPSGVDNRKPNSSVNKSTDNNEKSDVPEVDDGTKILNNLIGAGGFADYKPLFDKCIDIFSRQEKNIEFLKNRIDKINRKIILISSSLVLGTITVGTCYIVKKICRKKG